jgi:hypothetical protein
MNLNICIFSYVLSEKSFAPDPYKFTLYMRKISSKFFLLLRRQTVSKFKTKNNKDFSNLAGKILYFDVLFYTDQFPYHKTFCLSPRQISRILQWGHTCKKPFWVADSRDPTYFYTLLTLSACQDSGSDPSVGTNQHRF